MNGNVMRSDKLAIAKQPVSLVQDALPKLHTQYRKDANHRWQLKKDRQQLIW